MTRTTGQPDLQLFRTVPCPTCRAATGEDCAYRGRRDGRTHISRQTRAIRRETKRGTA